MNPDDLLRIATSAPRAKVTEVVAVLREEGYIPTIRGRSTFGEIHDGGLETVFVYLGVSDGIVLRCHPSETTLLLGHLIRAGVTATDNIVHYPWTPVLVLPTDVSAKVVPGVPGIALEATPTITDADKIVSDLVARMVADDQRKIDLLTEIQQTLAEINWAVGVTLLQAHKDLELLGEDRPESRVPLYHMPELLNARRLLDQIERYNALKPPGPGAIPDKDDDWVDGDDDEPEPEFA